ncbi:AI-2E family transporter [Terrimonas pollutisoli]|uniref:AI-2E family transporter n=1 Tax=Terrimonas pollutisoli TaxID=3034147 RepID=UPI0023EBFCBA|nr:AI-2E family transporter [Terrimonas sp. H1YJ31]
MLQTSALFRAVLFLLLVFLVVAGVYFAKPFLIPLCFGALLAMLFLPLSRWLERKHIPKGLAILICILVLLSIISIVALLISWQVTDLTGEVSNIQNRLRQMLNEVEQYISTHFGIPVKQQEKLLQQQAQNSVANGVLANMGPALLGLLVDFILCLVYIFLFMYYRSRIKKFILQLIPGQQQENAQQILHDIQKVTQLYLTGIGLMILCLWVMYSIGFSIVGVKYAVFFAILCGLLEIVPFVGNFTGNMLAIVMVIIQGGGTAMILAVLLTYAIVQFLQTYLLEPLVVGAEVNINPLFTIIILVLGELIWGIPGMILAIPLLGIVKIVCDHIEPLKPYGFLIGHERKMKKPLRRQQ